MILVMWVIFLFWGIKVVLGCVFLLFMLMIVVLLVIIVCFCVRVVLGVMYLLLLLKLLGVMFNMFIICGVVMDSFVIFICGVVRCFKILDGIFCVGIICDVLLCVSILI